MAEPDNPANGPVKTIDRALRIAGPSDRIVLINTGVPYRDSISLAGENCSGTKGPTIHHRRKRRHIRRHQAGPEKRLEILPRRYFPIPTTPGRVPMPLPGGKNRSVRWSPQATSCPASTRASGVFLDHISISELKRTACQPITTWLMPNFRPELRSCMSKMS